MVAVAESTFAMFSPADRHPARAVGLHRERRLRRQRRLAHARQVGARQVVRRVRQLERPVGVPAHQVGELVADVEDDVEALVAGALEVGLDVLAGARLVLHGRARRHDGAGEVVGLRCARPLGEEALRREGGEADLREVGERGGALAVAAAGHAEDREALGGRGVDEGDHARDGREALLLHPGVLERGVVVEPHRAVLHVVVPEHGVVGVEDDRGDLAGGRDCCVRRVEVGRLRVGERLDLTDVGRGGLVGDAVGGLVVGADRVLDDVEVRDRLALGVGAGGAVGLHRERRLGADRGLGGVGGGVRRSCDADDEGGGGGERDHAAGAAPMSAAPESECVLHECLAFRSV